MKLYLLPIFILLSNFVIGQQTQEWLSRIENPEYKDDILNKENLKSIYLKYDFSTLIIPKQEFLGYIGNNFRRIKIYFTSVCKDTSSPENYKVEGLSIVVNNVSSFIGKINIEQVREYKSMHYGLDDIYKNAGFKSQGIIIGKYEFKEKNDNKHSGVFSGVMTLNWYLDKFEIIHYDHIECFSDRYRNNQYVGIWKDYNNGSEKVCNWGEYRIPFSGDLDIGAAEFSPSEKYYKMGWEDLKK